MSQNELHTSCVAEMRSDKRRYNAEQKSTRRFAEDEFAPDEVGEPNHKAHERYNSLEDFEFDQCEYFE